MKVYFYTFGCKVNQYETDCIAEMMENGGFERSDELKKSDILVVNTCTVTGNADIKLGQLLRKARRENPSIVIAVCGCYPQVYRKDDLISEADITVGESNKTDIPLLIKRFMETGVKQSEILPHYKGEGIEEMSLSCRKGKTRAIIKIQDGCNRFCSYCIIPYARGRCRSKPIDKIVEEAKTLVSSGHSEIVLVGINLSCYGEDLGDGTDLATAVSEVAKWSGAKRIRLGSLEPELLSEDIIKRLSEVSSLCDHFHLSLQSGCDKTLKEMRRKYDTAEYLKIVSELRRCFPGCAITTDVMTGFPGESEEDFLCSIEFIKSVGFAKVHVFPYSERRGTVAAERNDKVPLEIRYRRAEAVSKIASFSEAEYLRSMIGKTVEVLFEKERDSDWHIGHTRSYVLVKVKHFTDTLWKKSLNVRIISCESGYCEGVIE